MGRKSVIVRPLDTGKTHGGGITTIDAEVVDGPSETRSRSCTLHVADGDEAESLVRNVAWGAVVSLDSNWHCSQKRILREQAAYLSRIAARLLVEAEQQPNWMGD